jgi:hypothetical protein
MISGTMNTTVSSAERAPLTDVFEPKNHLTWHSHPVGLLNIFQTVYYLPLHNKVNSNAIRNSFLDDKHLHKNNTDLLPLSAMTHWHNPKCSEQHYTQFFKIPCNLFYESIELKIQSAYNSE